MNDDFYLDEPTPDHLADTGKVHTIRSGGGRRGIGALLLVGALALTGATLLVLMLPGQTQPTPENPVNEFTAATIDPALVVQPSAEFVQPTGVPQVAAQPTLDPQLMAALLSQPVGSELAAVQNAGFSMVRDTYNPFTIIPDRPRSEVIQYEVQSGDTIFSIAERYGLKPESIAWANDRSIIGSLRPGRTINILPVDGALWTVPSEQTIQQVAEQFRVDPYAIIDSPYNDLFSAEPTSVLPVGTQVVVPGGEAEQITWTARVETRDTSTNGAQNASASGGQIIFEPGDPGSCGWVDNPGNPGTWVYPMPPGSYQWTRGYSSYHTGVDLAASVGAPVAAANGGTVVFAGWNSYGYGYAVVLAHGSYMTLYGHLSAINVGCGQYVSAGQNIAAVGSTGNSSGPHLHFEIRYNNVTQDPTFTLPF